MATDKPRFTITLPEDVYEEVSEFKEEYNIRTQSKAIQQLILLGLQDLAEDSPDIKNVVKDDEFKLISGKDKRLLEWFRSLPPEKQQAILIAQDGPIDAL